jgi:polyhydroxyalkanoate synthesis regulator phasin
MKAKTLLQVLSLSTNLYIILKDEELMNKLSELAEKGKDKLNDFFPEEEGEDSGRIISRLIAKAKEAKEELEERMGRLAETVYEKMSIAHTKEIEKLQEQISLLELKLAETQNRVALMEQPNKVV